MGDKVQEDTILFMDYLIKILKFMDLLEGTKVSSSKNSSKLLSKTYKNTSTKAGSTYLEEAVIKLELNSKFNKQQQPAKHLILMVLFLLEPVTLLLMELF